MWLELLEKHMGKVIGALIGLIFGGLVLKYGFFSALFVTACAVGGFYLGKRLDERIDFRSLLAGIFHR